ncbi:MAG: VWA domain-containing protein [Phycisphaerae bacterium]|nr:VWA domain-containing protein [Phycisphaerae bacterium]
MLDWIANSFRNAWNLWWLPLALLPLVIHLLNRLRRKSIDWGAMRFLMASQATRNKRILLEEIALLVIRVLVLAALVLAVARPFIRNPRYGGRGQTRQDVVIVLDASSSMGLREGGTTRFTQAVSAAGKVIDSLADGDTVSVILAGPVPRSLTEGPEFLNGESRAALKRGLDGLAPWAGGMDMIRALDSAQACLAASRNPQKQIVVITDGQAEGWETGQSRRWAFLREVIDQSDFRPKVHVLSVGAAPGRVTNAAVTGIELDRAVVGADRPVRVRVTVTNTGTETGKDRSVELFVDDNKVGEEDLGRLQARASNTVEFEHRFSRAGPHLVRTSLTGEDQIDLDDVGYYSVQVYDRLGVLLVDGAPSSRPMGSETSYLSAALDPSDVEDEPAIDYVVDARRIELAETEDVECSDYRVVILANVPRLGERFLGRLSQFVSDGGGVLIAPGDQVELDWYNDHLLAGGKGLLPAKLGGVVGDAKRGEAGQRILAEGADHPTVRLSADPDKSDIDKVHVYRWFKLTPQADGASRIILRLSDGDPFVMDKHYGRGRVLLLATPLDIDWTNLPAAKVYVVMVHEMVYWLAQPSLSRWNVEPGQALVARLDAKTAGTTSVLADPTGRAVELTGERDGASMIFRYENADLPGVYRLMSPEGKGDPSAIFTVRPTGKEASLEPLSGRAREGLAERLGAAFAEDTDAVCRDMAIDTAGSELWQPLVAVVLGLLLAEVFLTRRIAAARHGRYADGVVFGQT